MSGSPAQVIAVNVRGLRLEGWTLSGPGGPTAPLLSAKSEKETGLRSVIVRLTSRTQS